MAMGGDEKWMDEALAMARMALPLGNTPVACVIVKNGVRVGAGENLVTTRRDPLLHCEVVAIQDACRCLGTADLSGACLYSTMEPCPMCAGAIAIAGIQRVVLGARHTDLGRTDLGQYTIERLFELMDRPVELVTGVRHEECVMLRRDWTRATGRWM
jgi:tRNA(adenine34) deaminase